MAKVLFSVISGADPISYCKDGPMLHLCRWERPDITALFLSGDFLRYHRSDDRYRKSIAELEKGSIMNLRYLSLRKRGWRIPMYLTLSMIHLRSGLMKSFKNMGTIPS